MNVYDILLIIVITAALFGAVMQCVRSRKSGRGCSGCCDGCSGCAYGENRSCRKQ